ncbi:MAG: DUF5010 domain-containing protein [Candidatus Colwellbacteria bacterium]|nr:DUF5010 domain-containing protein [Candidatus Colwellbacteria bacterium]
MNASNKIYSLLALLAVSLFFSLLQYPIFAASPGGTNDAQFVSQSVPVLMTAGQNYDVSITMKNIGTSNWTNTGNYKLGSQNPQDNTAWSPSSRVLLNASETVAPSQQKTFTFSVKAPSTPGTYNFQWRMVKEFVEWFGGSTSNMQVVVSALPLKNNAEFISQSVPTSMIAGQSYNVSLTMKNTGSIAWTQLENYKLGSQNPQDNTTWSPSSRVLLSEKDNILPGQQKTFVFNVRAPQTPGTYNFQWRMVKEFVEWFGRPTSNMQVVVSALPQSNTQTGAFFFYWHDCPQNNCDTSRMINKPSYLGSYSSLQKTWYKQEFKDMVAAGIDFVIPVSWGSGHPSFTWFRDSTVLPIMVQAIQEDNIPIKIAYFDDTNSVVAEWNNDNGRGYTSADGIPQNRQSSPFTMPLSDSNNWKYFYDKKMRPFFNTIPQNLWATHNGMSVDRGGRPLIFEYSGLYFKDPEYSDEMWSAIRGSFKAHFKNTSQQAIDPFIVLNYDWLVPGWNSHANILATQVDGEYIWGGSNYSDVRQRTLNGYTTADVSPGSNCETNCVGIKPRNFNIITGQIEDEGTHLRSMFQKWASGSNLILVESWNELWEGTGIQKSTTYSKNGGGYLPDDYYMRLLRSLVKPSPLIVSVPTPISLQQTTSPSQTTSPYASSGESFGVARNPQSAVFNTNLFVGMQNEGVQRLQEYLAKDPTLYPEGLITGFFGALTKKAVIRLQERYANEVLKPVGLTQGTGYVGPFTRAKLNEL